ncbi:MAG: hypothetical protein KGR26_14220, partial [Cyanobacteria bacterium REEB65]|nr:hypothetical protein [Cyanobacteria bacterium REEB65]
SRTDFAFTLTDPAERRCFEDLEEGRSDGIESALLARNYQLWRESQVDDTVHMVHQMLQHRSRPLDLGVATFRSEWWSRKTKLQNWRHWADNEWTTFTTEMLYSGHAKAIGRWIDEETDDDTRPTLLYPILGVFRMAHPRHDLLAEIAAVRGHGRPGVILFSLSHMTDALLDELARGPFRHPAIVPQRDLLGAARSVLADVRWRYLERLYPSGDWGTVASARAVAGDLDEILNSWPQEPSGVQQHAALETKLRELGDAVRYMDRAKPSFAREIRGRLSMAADLVRAYGHRVDTTAYVPVQEPPLAEFTKALRISARTGRVRRP